MVTYNSRMSTTLQEFFLKQKEAIRKRTNEVFALLRPEHMAWKPEKGALSVGDMLQHLWVSEEGVRRVALDGNFAYYETRIPKGLAGVLGKTGSLEEELKNIERVHRETLAIVAAKPAELFEEERARWDWIPAEGCSDSVRSERPRDTSPRAIDDVFTDFGDARGGTIPEACEMSTGVGSVT